MQTGAWLLLSLAVGATVAFDAFHQELDVADAGSHYFDEFDTDAFDLGFSFVDAGDEDESRIDNEEFLFDAGDSTVEDFQEMLQEDRAEKGVTEQLEPAGDKPKTNFATDKKKFEDESEEKSRPGHISYVVKNFGNPGCSKCQSAKFKACFTLQARLAKPKRKGETFRLCDEDVADHCKDRCFGKMMVNTKIRAEHWKPSYCSACLIQRERKCSTSFNAAERNCAAEAKGDCRTANWCLDKELNKMEDRLDSEDEDVDEDVDDVLDQADEETE
mmetsp:Transcript_46773/g.71524  ORF Transcript_46773/g.71524 Transcript_46773/m.71524 type:complete len:273 (-) Transcript_46773:264-1082(-)